MLGETTTSFSQALWGARSLEGGPDHPDQGHERIERRARAFGLCVHPDTDAAGDCQFDSIADQLRRNPMVEGCQGLTKEGVREQAIRWLRQHKDYRLSDDPENEETLESWIKITQGTPWESYCDRMAQPRVWGDDITLMAIAEVYRVKVVILSSTVSEEHFVSAQIPKGAAVDHGRTLYLCHFLEIHYGSLITPADRDALEADKRLDMIASTAALSDPWDQGRLMRDVFVFDDEQSPLTNMDVDRSLALADGDVAVAWERLEIRLGRKVKVRKLRVDMVKALLSPSSSKLDATAELPTDHMSLASTSTTDPVGSNLYTSVPLQDDLMLSLPLGGAGGGCGGGTGIPLSTESTCTTSERQGQLQSEIEQAAKQVAMLTRKLQQLQASSTSIDLTVQLVDAKPQVQGSSSSASGHQPLTGSEKLLAVRWRIPINRATPQDSIVLCLCGDVPTPSPAQVETLPTRGAAEGEAHFQVPAGIGNYHVQLLSGPHAIPICRSSDIAVKPHVELEVQFDEDGKFRITRQLLWGEETTYDWIGLYRCSDVLGQEDPAPRAYIASAYIKVGCDWLHLPRSGMVEGRSYFVRYFSGQKRYWPVARSREFQLPPAAEQVDA